MKGSSQDDRGKKDWRNKILAREGNPDAKLAHDYYNKRNENSQAVNELSGHMSTLYPLTTKGMVAAQGIATIETRRRFCRRYSRSNWTSDTTRLQSPAWGWTTKDPKEQSQVILDIILLLLYNRMPNKHAFTSGWRNDVSSKISGKVVVRFEKPEVKEAAAARRKAAEAEAAEAEAAETEAAAAEAAEAEAQRKAIGGLAIGKRTRERVSIADQYRAANLPLPLPIRSPISRNASQSSEYATPPSSPIGNRGTYSSSVPARSYASPANTHPPERTWINKVQKWLTPPPWLPNPPGKRWRLGGMRSRTMRSRRKGTQRKGIPRKGTRRKGTQKKGNPEKGNPKKGNPKKGNPKKGNPEKVKSLSIIDLFVSTHHTMRSHTTSCGRGDIMRWGDGCWRKVGIRFE